MRLKMAAARLCYTWYQKLIKICKKDWVYAPKELNSEVCSSAVTD